MPSNASASSLPSSGNAGSGAYAKDKLGNDIKIDEWLKTHGPNDRTLAQGLKVTAITWQSRVSMEYES